MVVAADAELEAAIKKRDDVVAAADAELKTVLHHLEGCQGASSSSGAKSEAVS